MIKNKILTKLRMHKGNRSHAKRPCLFPVMIWAPQRAVCWMSKGRVLRKWSTVLLPPGCSLHYFLLDLINPQCPCEIARGGKCIYSTLRLMGRLRGVKHLLIVSGSSQFSATQWKAVPKRLESFNLSPCCINHTNSLNPFLGDAAFCSQSALYLPGLLECPCSPSP